jgi:hypothetical protein
MYVFAAYGLLSPLSGHSPLSVRKLLGGAREKSPTAAAFIEAPTDLTGAARDRTVSLEVRFR